MSTPNNSTVFSNDELLVRDSKKPSDLLLKDENLIFTNRAITMLCEDLEDPVAAS
jgi:hypothetical protein